MHDTRIHRSNDGSDTLWSEMFGEYFHNPNGAIAESRHVFFDTPKLIPRIRKTNPFHILEVGFGTGLNLLLLLEQLYCSDDLPADITFTSVEAWPLGLKQAVELNYPQQLDLPDAQDILERIFTRLRPGWNEFRLMNTLTLRLFIGRLEQLPAPPEKVHAILFDPFSPEKDPELWTRTVFQSLARWSAPDVLLSTYGAASGARAAMASAGWKTARAPGALGKREMTLAAQAEEHLGGWKLLNAERMAERYRRGEFGTAR